MLGNSNIQKLMSPPLPPPPLSCPRPVVRKPPPGERHRWSANPTIGQFTVYPTPSVSVCKHSLCYFTSETHLADRIQYNPRPKGFGRPTERDVRPREISIIITIIKNKIAPSFQKTISDATIHFMDSFSRTFSV